MLKPLESRPGKDEENDTAWLEQERASRARELGLPEDSSWAEIYFIEDEQGRALVAVELGIPITEHDIEAKRLGLTDSVYPSWRNLLTEVLGLASNVPAKRIVARIREIKQSGWEEA